MSDIVVVGSLNMDMVVKVEKRPSKGETVLGHDFFMSPGGKGANQAYGVAALGGSVSMIGCIGDDVFGEQLKQNLVSVGVDVSGLKVNVGTASGSAFITLDPEGDNSIIVAPGANHSMTPDIIREKADMIKSAKLLIVQLEIPLETVLEAITVAKEAGVKVLLDPAPVQELPAEILEKVDYITPNMTELSSLTGIEVTDSKSAQVAAVKLLDQGVGTVFAKMGGKGVTVVTANHTNYLKGYEVKAVDTTAAGDAFCGAIAVAMVSGKDIWESGYYGNAVGALTVTKPGAQASIPTTEDVNDFLREVANGTN
ncbi:MAG: ribokinase [Tuberibacillus sp.]